MGDPEQLAAGMEQLARYAERAGRDPAEIGVVYQVPVTGTADQMAGNIRRYQDMGISQIIVGFDRSIEDLNQVLENLDEFATTV